MFGSERTKGGMKCRAWQIAINYLHQNACWKYGSWGEETKMAGAKSESSIQENLEEYKWEGK